MIRFGKFGKFIACGGYPECKTTFNLPSGALIKNCKNICDVCTYPKIQVIKKGKRPQEICINPTCSSKLEEGVTMEMAEKKTEPTKIDKKCPQCGLDLIIRSGFYGQFVACPGFPKCKYTEKIGQKGDTKYPKTEVKETKTKAKKTKTSITKAKPTKNVKPKSTKKSSK